VLQRPSTHETAIWYLDNNVYIGSDSGPTLPASWNLKCVWRTLIAAAMQIAADFSGDGKAGYLLYNVNTQQTGLYYLNNKSRIQHGAKRRVVCLRSL
jgi:hypothetical protein